MRAMHLIFIVEKGCVQAESTTGQTEKFNIKLSHILAFTTGNTTIPPMGFSPTPNINFHEKSVFPTANTCANTLSLSLLNETYATFKYNFCLGITNAIGFGRV